MDLMNAMKVSASGMAAQSERIKVVSENIANANSVVAENGEGPYRRKILNFKAEVNRATGLSQVKVDKISRDQTTPLRPAYEPNSPHADENGYVLYPNVNTVVENVDMREAARMYEANMSAIETSKSMMSRSLDMLR